MIHELIKIAVLDEVRELYWRGIEDRVVVYDEQAYAEDVLVRAPKNKFRASLLWLVEGDAITLAQADRLDDIYAHRHDLLKYIVDPEFEPDIALLTDALTMLKSIRRFWTSIEKDIGSFEEFGDVDLDEVTPLSLAVLQRCIDACIVALTEGDEADRCGAVIRWQGQVRRRRPGADGWSRHRRRVRNGRVGDSG